MLLACFYFSYPERRIMKKKNSKTKNTKHNTKNNIYVNREHKDRLFKKLFGSAENKANMLSLYNALNGSSYSDETELQIYTIEDVIYLGMRNDVGFILDSYISLHEQQSTYNPNTPLRGLLYHAKMYEKFIAQNKLDIYSSKLKKIPTPQFYVFCNDERFKEDKKILKLSDAFIQPVKEGSFEWTAIMININKGYNPDLLDKCETLNDYATLINKIREFKEISNSIEIAVTKAVDWCIENDILSEYLRMHKSEVIGMVLTEYNQKEIMDDIRSEAFEDGRLSEIANTEKEKKRADAAEAKVLELEAELARIKKLNI